MTTNDKLSDEALQAAKDRIAKSARSDRGPQQKPQNPLVSDERISDAWARVQMEIGRASGSSMGFVCADHHTNGMKSVRDLYEAERTKLHGIMARMATELAELRSRIEHDGCIYTAQAVPLNEIAAIDTILADYNALTKP